MDYPERCHAIRGSLHGEGRGISWGADKHEVERERAARLADEMTRAFAGHGTNPAYVDLVASLAGGDGAASDRPIAQPLSWFKRFFH